MLDLQREYLRLVAERWDESRADAARVAGRLREAAAPFGEEPIEACFVPKLLTPDTAARLAAIAETAYGIFEKVIAAFRSDAAYRRLFGYAPDTEALLLAPTGYDCAVPMARVDIFLDEASGGFTFCEFNTDGSSAMNEDRQLGALLADTAAGRAFAERHVVRPFELFDSWVAAFLGVWREYGGAGLPRVAIVDFMESASRQEFAVFAEAFRRRGCECVIAEIRDLRYRDGRLLTPDGVPVDAVYRRAVTSDLLAHAAEVGDFLAAVRGGTVCCVGAPVTQAAHDKRLFVLLRHPATLRLLTLEERAFVAAHVPESYPLENGAFDREAVLRDPAAWIVKPMDAYGGFGVTAGGDCTDAEWRRVIDESVGAGMLLQRYTPPFETEIPDFTSPTPRFVRVRNQTGLYLYAGRFAGVYSRVGNQRVISARRHEMGCATLVAER